MFFFLLGIISHFKEKRRFEKKQDDTQSDSSHSDEKKRRKPGRSQAYIRSSFRGVYQQYGKWVVRGNAQYIGCFESEEDAARQCEFSLYFKKKKFLLYPLSLDLFFLYLFVFINMSQKKKELYKISIAFYILSYKSSFTLLFFNSLLVI